LRTPAPLSAGRSTLTCFRDSAATSIAIDDPEHIGIASCLLGNSSATTEKYYNQARAVEAARTMQNTLLALRHGKTPTE
jgi:integrase/recombinase XerD